MHVLSFQENVGPGCEDKKSSSSAVLGIAGAQPGLATTIDAQAEPRKTASFIGYPPASEAIKPAMKLSPAPVGLTASTGKMPVRISSPSAKVTAPSGPNL